MRRKTSIKDILTYLSRRRIALLAALRLSMPFLWLVRTFTHIFALPFLWASNALYDARRKVEDLHADVRLLKQADEDRRAEEAEEQEEDEPDIFNSVAGDPSLTAINEPEKDFFL